MVLDIDIYIYIYIYRERERERERETLVTTTTPIFYAVTSLDKQNRSLPASQGFTRVLDFGFYIQLAKGDNHSSYK